MKVTLMPGIESISGSMKGSMGKRTVFMTFNKPDGKKETRMYFRRKEDYERKTPVSEHELEVRALFCRRQELVKLLIDEYKGRGLYLSKAEAWRMAKEQIPNA